MSERNTTRTIRERLAAAVAPPVGSATDDEPEPATYTRSGSPGTYRYSTERSTARRVSPPKDDLARYWRLYETTPLIRAPTNQFASDVIRPGYDVVADDPATAAFLREWTAGCVIHSCSDRNDLSVLLRQIPIQRVVRGTVLIEHVSAAEDADRLTRLQLINPEDATPYKRPDSSLLLQPGDTEVEGAKLTPDGDAAAWVLFDRRHGYGATDSAEIRLAADEVTRLVSDADIGEPFGTSAVEAVADRLDALRAKLAANEDAIESMAFGRWFFGFDPLVVSDGNGGEKVLEWADDDMDDFMADLGDLEPGDHLGHDGTIDIQNVPGEVADLLEFYEFDVEYVLSAMPAPKFAVGWGKDLNQWLSESQEREHAQKVRDERRDIEAALTPILSTVAEQNDYDPAGVELRIREANDPDASATGDGAVDGREADRDPLTGTTGQRGMKPRPEPRT